MGQALTARLELERRLLGALICWPTPTTIEPRDFVSPAHAYLFCAIEEAGDRLLGDRTLAVLAELMARDGTLDHLGSVGGLETYVVESLMTEWFAYDDLADYVADVMACPRCGARCA